MKRWRRQQTRITVSNVPSAWFIGKDPQFSQKDSSQRLSKGYRLPSLLCTAVSHAWAYGAASSSFRHHWTHYRHSLRRWYERPPICEGLFARMPLWCHSFLPLCRKHIFSYISINIRMPRYDGEAFGQLFLESPDIARYVRKLKIYIKGCDKHFLSFPVSPLTRLQSLSYSGFDLEWGDLSSPIQRSLVNLMHLLTLTHLDVERISGFSISNLNVCTNIKHLFLCEFDIIV